MSWITEYLTNGKVESTDSQTLYVDLPQNEDISLLMLEMRMTNSATVNNLYSILDDIDTIAVVADGVKTLVNVTSEVASYLAFVAQNGLVCDHRFFDGASAVTRLHLPIYFGRYAYDREFGLNTGNYKSVQLQITYSLNTTNFATGTFTHTFSFVRPLERINFQKLIRSRTVKTETPSASVQTITHKLPVTYPWHYLGARIQDVDADLNTDLTAVDVNIDEGRLHLLNVDMDEAYYYDKLRYRNANSYINQPVVTGQDTVHTFGEWAYPRGAVPVVLGDRIATVTSVAGEQAVLAVYDASAGAQASDAIAVATDWPSPNPHKCFTLYDGREKPFAASGYTQGKVDYTMAALTMTIETFIQEIVQGAL